MANEKSPKNKTYFTCISCQYKTNNKKDFYKNISTLNYFKNNKTNKNPLTIKYKCRKEYKHLSCLIKKKS